jgi:transcriptional regulator with XRE-family HTH domain
LDKLNFIIAQNLKKLREERKLSLDNVAKLTGVSKSMLGQIEREEVNPTVSTVWKISNGLKISFTQLMSRPETDIELVNKSEIQPLIEDDGRFRNFPVFPFDSTRRFEMYSLEIDEGGCLNAEAHPQGTQEFITVF